MRKLKRRLTIAFIVILLALITIAKPFASELSPDQLGRQMGQSMYDNLINGEVVEE